jgi:HlyD family secretion protein
MEIALLQLERNLEDATITSPIDGVITAVAAKEGAIPVGGGFLFTIEDSNNLEIVTYFREYDLARLYRTMEVSIIPSGAGNVAYSGYISRISPAASPSPIVEFKTIVRVTSEDTNLRIGMTARVIVAAY